MFYLNVLFKFSPEAQTALAAEQETRAAQETGAAQEAELII